MVPNSGYLGYIEGRKRSGLVVAALVLMKVVGIIKVVIILIVLVILVKLQAILKVVIFPKVVTIIIIILLVILLMVLIALGICALCCCNEGVWTPAGCQSRLCVRSSQTRSHTDD